MKSRLWLLTLCIGSLLSLSACAPFWEPFGPGPHGHGGGGEGRGGDGPRLTQPAQR